MSPPYRVALLRAVLLRVYGLRDTAYEVRANWTVLNFVRNYYSQPSQEYCRPILTHKSCPMLYCNRGSGSRAELDLL